MPERHRCFLLAALATVPLFGLSARPLEPGAAEGQDVPVNRPQTSPATSIPTSLPEDSIPNYRRLGNGLAAAGQPPAEALARLKTLGFKTVINLRPVAEDPIVAEEQAIVEAQGLRYLSVPVTPATFSAADVERVRQVLDDAGAAPVLLHCASSNRVGAVLGVIAHQRGRSLEEAEAHAKKAGLSSAAMVEAFRKVAAETSPSKR